MIHIPVNIALTGDLMMDTQKIQLTLAQIDEGLEPELERDLIDAARFIKTLAQAYVRVDTGSLQESIRVEHIRRLAVRVRAGGYVTNPKTKKLVDYAIYVEERFPFMRPAWQSGKNFVTMRAEESLRRLALRVSS